MARPNWEYIRVDVLLPDHPKLDGLSYAAKWTLIELWCWCGRNRTDGFVRDSAWRRIGTSAARRSLVSSGLCARVEGGFFMHDYLAHQRSREQIAAVSAQRSLAGKKSAEARRDAEQTVEQTVELPVEQNGNKTSTEVEVEVEAKKNLTPAEVIHSPVEVAWPVPQNGRVDLKVCECGAALDPDGTCFSCREPQPVRGRHAR